MSGNEFHVSLLPKLVQEDANSVFSSWSIFSILSMCSAGSDNLTLEEFNKVLRIEQNSIHNKMMDFRKAMNKMKKQLSIADAIFTQVKPCLPFKEICTKKYFSDCTRTVFPQPGLNQVNEFVKKNTKNMIPKILDNLGPLTRMVLVNAIYFKANWERKFLKKNTKNNYNFDSYGKKVKVSMMSRTDTTELFAKHDINGIKFQSCTLPYDGKKFSMMFLKPTAKGKGGMEDLIGKGISSNPEFITKVWKNQRKVKLKKLLIPKFKVESKFNLPSVLKDMGLVDAFKDTADFSKLTEEDKLFIDDVIHKAKIIVNESGTEAAAASVVVMRTLSMRVPSKVKPPQFVLDRPFMCFIIHNDTGSVIFTNHIVAPKFVVQKKK